MEVFAEFLVNIGNVEHRNRTEEILDWVTNNFPNLKPEIKWNQPMFTDHGTYIIGFSVAKHHLAAAPERAGIVHFSDDIVQAGYTHSKELIRFPWDRSVDFALLENIIEFNILDKAN
ncbi:iron chaperone [Virgibacillus oceani]|uniref:Intracellular iron chaperone frataxin n=1 Tax=Virgibacillus oceani TaxID=1479511 RepID=A0A917M9V7_9BACI|nr:iron chaperone [Virgibacillus oceani]GGG86937.1 intracellular iron chaperone frataxin [Virgibacillus oceani]